MSVLRTHKSNIFNFVADVLIRTEEQKNKSNVLGWLKAHLGFAVIMATGICFTYYLEEWCSHS